MNFRGLILASLAASVVAVGASPSEKPADEPVHVVRTYFGWRDAASFKRISEYFTGKENTGGEIVVRTHPEERNGYYFLIRVANANAATPARLVLQVVTPDSATPRTFTFNAALPAKESVFDLGVTGSDWPDRKVNAVAWRLDVMDEGGRILATTKSYLWEKPAGA